MIDLSHFRDLIAAKLLAESSTANVVFGRGHLFRRDNQGPLTANRVVVAPGTPDGEWGTVSVGSKAHTRVQPQEGTHAETVTVQVWAHDASDSANESKQYKAVRALWQCVLRSMGAILREQAHTHTLWGSNVTFKPNPVDRRHGEMAQIIFSIDFAVRAPTPDQVVIAEAAPPEPEVEP